MLNLSRESLQEGGAGRVSEEQPGRLELIVQDLFGNRHSNSIIFRYVYPSQFKPDIRTCIQSMRSSLVNWQHNRLCWTDFG